MSSKGFWCTLSLPGQLIQIHFSTKVHAMETDLSALKQTLSFTQALCLHSCHSVALMISLLSAERLVQVTLAARHQFL